MERVVDPPLNQLDRLPDELQEGERNLICLFHRHLDPRWEMYVQPHLNGLRPDLVLLNPNVGIAVFEIKDWDLDAMRYFVQGSELRAERGGKPFSMKNPIHKIRLYEKQILELYCPRLNERAGMAVITAGLVFTKAPRERIVELLGPLQDEGMKDHPQYYPIAGREDIDPRHPQMGHVFPEWKRQSSSYMTPDLAADLRGWLRDPAFSKEQRLRPIPLDEQQRKLVQTRTSSGYRRIRGPAGSGKSVVLACRAAELAGSGKEVLVVCYNITLLNYLRDLSVRHTVSSRTIRRRLDFLNFHNWCKRICLEVAPDEYRKIWCVHQGDGDVPDAPDAPGPALDKVAHLVRDVYQSDEHKLPTYDAILVDEGQDFQPDWWRVLQCALRRKGEMLLVADNTQDIYGTSRLWTGNAMRDAGFTGSWSELRRSYRLPEAMVPLVRQFAKTYLPAANPPTYWQSGLQIQQPHLRWVHAAPGTAEQACVDELCHLMATLPEGTAVADIAFICPRTELGRNVANRLQAQGVRVAHTFSEDDRASRRQKRVLFQGDARVKATTIHSFKGWESNVLLVFVDSIDSQQDRALFYTAMTRLRKGQQSVLTVVSACDSLKRFGQDWRYYEDLTSPTARPCL